MIPRWHPFCSSLYSTSVSASVCVCLCFSTVLFDYLINGLRRLLRKQATVLFYGWLIKQSSGGGAAGVEQGETGWHATDACEEIFTWLEWRRCHCSWAWAWQLGMAVGMGTRLGRREMSMSQPKKQKSRAKSDAKKKLRQTENRRPKAEETQRR